MLLLLLLLPWSHLQCLLAAEALARLLLDLLRSMSTGSMANSKAASSVVAGAALSSKQPPQHTCKVLCSSMDSIASAPPMRLCRLHCYVQRARVDAGLHCVLPLLHLAAVAQPHQGRQAQHSA